MSPGHQDKAACTECANILTGRQPAQVATSRPTLHTLEAHPDPWPLLGWPRAHWAHCVTVVTAMMVMMVTMMMMMVMMSFVEAVSINLVGMITAMFFKEDLS